MKPRGIRMTGHSGRSAVFSTETGSAVVIALMFVFVFLAMGLALYYLVMSSMRGTELESKEVKAFNVAEAGVDAGMLRLAGNWPTNGTNPAVLDGTELRADFDPNEFPDPTRSPASDFVQVEFHDNTGAVYDPTSPSYDSNRDGLIYVASESNVDDDRHRIIILAERHTYNLDFPFIALYALAFDANGPGLDVFIDPTQTEPLPILGGTAVPAYYNNQIGRATMNLGPQVLANPSDPGSFDSWVGTSLIGMLRTIATDRGTYFTDPTLANQYLLSADAPDSIVYLETTSNIEIGGMTPIGTKAKPVVLVVDAGGPGHKVGLDFRGTADFYGIIVVDGDPVIRGTSSIYGSFICSGTLSNLGNGYLPEIHYNGDIIKHINQAFTVSVNIVPNSWEEYTTARETGS